MGMRTSKPLCNTPISEAPTRRLLSDYPPHPPRSRFDHILAGSNILTAKLHMCTGASHQPLPLWLESLTCRTGYYPPTPTSLGDSQASESPGPLPLYVQIANG